MEKVTTGFAVLDSLLSGGFKLGDLIIVAGTSTSGKTSLVSNIAVNAARNGVQVAVFSLQLRSVVLRKRMLSALTKLNTHPDFLQHASMEDVERLAKADSLLSSLNLTINDSAPSSPAAIRKVCEQLLLKQGLGLVIVDDQEMLNVGSQSHLSREYALANSMRYLSQAIGLPFILTVGVNKPQRSDWRLVLSDIPKPWVASADTVLIIDSESLEYGLDPQVVYTRRVVLRVVKQASRTTGEVNLRRHPSFCLFEEIAQADRT